MCAVSSLPRVCSAAVTWITRYCLLTFDEFERVMRAVKKCFGNTITIGNNLLKLNYRMYNLKKIAVYRVYYDVHSSVLTTQYS